jgi:hypothetical protein
LAIDTQSQGEDFAGDEIDVRVDDVTEEKLGAGVQDDDAHLNENVERPTPNVQCRSQKC